MELGQPDTPSADSDRGRQLHGAVENAIRVEIGLADAAAVRAEFSTLDPYDQSAVDFCLNQFHAAYSGFKDLAGGKVLIEHRLDLTGIAPVIGHGTLDLALVIPNEFGLIHDYKFGQYPVDPAPINLQLAAYALGLATEFNCPSVKVVIVQPATNHVSEFVYDKKGLAAALADLRMIVAACEAPAAPLAPGAKQCRYCKAAAICTALAVRAETLPTVKPVDQLTPAEMGAALNVLPLVKRRVEALEARALAELERDAAAVPGWGLVPGRESRGWVADHAETEKALTALAAELGKPADAVINRTIATPAQIEKAWGKAKRVRDALDPLIKHSLGRPKLAPLALAAPATMSELPAPK